MSWRDRQTPHGRNVAGERQLELARSEIPHFHNPVSRTSDEPLISGLEGDAADPAQMSGNDSHKPPWWVVRRPNRLRRLVQLEGL